MGASDAESGCAASRSLPARRFDRGFPGSAERAYGQGRAEPSPSVITRLTAEWNADYERWQKRDLSARRYVYVWRTGFTCRPHGRPSRMHAGPDRRHARGQERTRRFPDRRSRERAELARVAGRREAAWPEDPRPILPSAMARSVCGERSTRPSGSAIRQQREPRRYPEAARALPRRRVTPTALRGPCAAHRHRSISASCLPNSQALAERVCSRRLPR